MFFDVQEKLWRVKNVLPVRVDVNDLLQLRCWHVAQHGCLHGLVLVSWDLS